MTEAAKYLGMSPNTLRKYSDLGLIKAFRRDRYRMFNIEDLDSFRQSDVQLDCERPVIP